MSPTGDQSLGTQKEQGSGFGIVPEKVEGNKD